MYIGAFLKSTQTGLKAVRFPADRVYNEKRSDNLAPKQSGSERSGKSGKRGKGGMDGQEESWQGAGPWRSRSGRVSSDKRGATQKLSPKRAGNSLGTEEVTRVLTRVVSVQRGGTELKGTGPQREWQAKKHREGQRSFSFGVLTEGRGSQLFWSREPFTLKETEGLKELLFRWITSFNI